MQYLKNIIAISLVLAFMGCTSDFARTPPLAEDGVLDLAGWDFAKDGSVVLSGDWEFYWSQLLTPADFSKEPPDTQTGLIAIPSAWDGMEVDGQVLNRNGYATLRLKVLHGNFEEIMAFKLPAIMSAYVLYVNGKEVMSKGEIGKTIETMIPRHKPDVADFVAHENQLDIVIAISNFQYKKGGLINAVKLGPSKMMWNMKKNRIAFELFLFGTILFMGIYHTCLYLFRSKDKTPIVFGIYCFSAAAYTIFTGEKYFLELFPDVGHELYTNCLYVTLFLSVTSFVVFVRSLFPEEFPKFYYNLSIFSCVCFFCFVLAVPSSISTYAIKPFQILTLVGILITIYSLIISFIRKREGAGIFLLGVVFLFLSVINDILYHNRVLRTGDYTPIGLFLFFFFQASILSIRFSNAFTKVEELSDGLSVAEKKFRGIFEDAIDGIFQITTNGRVLICNPSAAKILGYDSTEEVMEEVGDFIGKVFVEPDKLADILLVIESEKSIKGFELEACQKNGSIIVLQLNASLHSEAGQDTFVEGIISDITESKRAEKLQIDKEAAIASNQAKGEFLANMSHEIRTPMNGVLVAAELAMGEKLPPRAEQYLKIISNSGKSLLGIINDILDFSKIEAGKLDIEIIPFDLNTLLMNIGELFSSKASNKQVEMLFDIEHGAPMALLGDPVRVEQIFRNLVGNSIKFTEKGDTITVGLQVENITSDAVVMKFHVKDTGKGMKAEYLDNLFDAFTQEDASTTRKYGGTGLGMSICKQLVDLMEGEIWATSEIDKGTTFYFTLKFKRQPVEQEKNLSFSERISKLKVLVVDDSKLSLNIVGKILDSFGYESVLLQHPEKALDFLGKNAIDLVITDLYMPKINGLKLSATIKQRWPDIPIIMLTGFGQDTEKKKAKRIGISNFLTKPVSMALLFDSIKYTFGEKKEDTQILDDDVGYYQKLQGIKVLLAEDNKVNQALAKAVLSKVGIRIDVANNGREAVEAVLRTEYAAVLMDMQMPEMDGYEATREIRKNPMFAKLPIIAMTANAMKGDEEKCLEAGMDGYVTKPIKQDVLFKTLWNKLEISNEIAEESSSDPVPELDGTPVPE